MSAAARRAQIVEHAIAVFAERGPAATTSASLARACGVSEALLFRLFGDKRGLYAAIVQRVVERGQGVFPTAAADARDDLEVFRQMAEWVLVRGDEDPSFLRLLLHSALEGSELTQLFHQARGVRVVGFLADYVRTRMREGAFREVDPDLVARGFLGMVHQLAMARHVYRVPVPPRHTPARVAREYAELVTRGLARDPAPPARRPRRPAGSIPKGRARR